MELWWYIFMTTLLLTIAKTCAQQRIYGGRSVKLGEFPMMAQILLTENQVHICGGTIIDHQRILTGAHCFPCRDIKICITKRQVMVGDVDLHGRVGQPNSRQTIPIESVIIHENFDLDEYDNDIAVVKVRWSIRFSNNVRPATLATRRPGLGEKCSICGWGATETNPHPTTLLTATVGILDPSICQNSFKHINVEVMVCAGDPNAKNTSCHRDSGGPLICNGSLVGIVSYGNLLCKAVSVYTDVAKLMPWILEKTRRKANKGCSSQNTGKILCLIILFAKLFKFSLSV